MADVKGHMIVCPFFFLCEPMAIARSFVQFNQLEYKSHLCGNSLLRRWLISYWLMRAFPPVYAATDSSERKAGRAWRRN